MLDYRIEITYTCTTQFENHAPRKETRTACMTTKDEFLKYMADVKAARKELGFEIHMSDNKERWTYHFQNRIFETTSVFTMRRLTTEEYNKLNK